MKVGHSMESKTRPPERLQVQEEITVSALVYLKGFVEEQLSQERRRRWGINTEAWGFFITFVF